MFWKVYAWLFLAANLASFALLACSDLDPDRPPLLLWMDVPISVVALIGVMGFAYRRQFATREFWCAWLVACFSWDILNHSGLLEQWMRSGLEPAHPEMLSRALLQTLLYLPVMLPTYLLLFLYYRRWFHLVAGPAAASAMHPTERSLPMLRRP